MSGGKKKKSAAKRNTVSKPARFTVAPLSPVRTRSKGGKSKSAQVNNAPEVATPIMTPAPIPAEVIVPVETASSVTDLEKRSGTVCHRWRQTCRLSRFGRDCPDFWPLSRVPIRDSVCPDFCYVSRFLDSDFCYVSRFLAIPERQLCGDIFQVSVIRDVGD